MRANKIIDNIFYPQMIKKEIKILFFVGGAAIFSALLLVGCNQKANQTGTSQNDNMVSEAQNINTNREAADNISSQENGSVPMLQEADIVRIFFTLINEKQINDAISMMTPKMIGDESQKQAWGVQFNSFKSLKVSNVEESMKEEWSDSQHNYKVTLDVQMKPEAAQVPIPYYGWDEGSNIRWVTLEKISGIWKISSIATGP